MVHLTRDLVEILIQNIIVPSASTFGDVDGILQTLKHGIVNYVLETGDAPKDALARIFNKSDRWIYRQLEEMDRQKEVRHVGDKHEGYELMAKVVEFYLQLYPREAPIQACVHALRKLHFNVVVQTLEPVLNLLVDQGYLSKVVIEAGDHRETVFRAYGPTTSFTTPDDMNDRMAKIAKRSRSIIPLLRAYAQGHPLGRMTLLQVGLPEERVRTLIDKTSEYMFQLAQDLHEGLEEEGFPPPEYEEFRMLILAGPGPFPDSFNKR